MFKRLRAYVFGKREQAPLQELSLYPIVGSSTTDADATVAWSGAAAEGGLDRTVFVPSAGPSRGSSTAASQTAERQRLAWPARDANRTVPTDPPRTGADHASPPAGRPGRPAEDVTVLVARRPRPRRDAV